MSDVVCWRRTGATASEVATLWHDRNMRIITLTVVIIINARDDTDSQLAVLSVVFTQQYGRVLVWMKMICIQ